MDITGLQKCSIGFMSRLLLNYTSVVLAVCLESSWKMNLWTRLESSVEQVFIRHSIQLTLNLDSHSLQPIKVLSARGGGFEEVMSGVRFFSDITFRMLLFGFIRADIVVPHSLFIIILQCSLSITIP